MKKLLIIILFLPLLMRGQFLELMQEDGMQIPYSKDALVYLDGTIIQNGGNYYFKDKTKNNRNFLITNYDFNTDWVKGLPYKTLATISAPSGDTVLINNDINNYLYASNGTPNQIPVISLFQDIDYEHKIFTKHASQILDINSVEIYEPRVLEIVVYYNVKSGVELTNCQTYYNVPTEQTNNVRWVSKNGNDGNDGSKAHPWLTLQKADGATATYTIYVKSGIYSENYSGNGYLWLQKELTWKSLGLVEVRAASGTSRVLYNVNKSRTMERFIFSNSGGMTSILTTYTANDVRTSTYNYCKIIGGSSNWVTSFSSETINMNYCLIAGAGNTTSTNFVNLLNTCYLYNSQDYAKKNIVVLNNKIKNYGLLPYQEIDVSIKGNKVFNNVAFISATPTTNSSHTIDISYNNLYLTGGSNVTLISSIEYTGVYFSINAHNNKFICNSAISGISYIFHFITPKLNFYNNIMINYTASEIGLLDAGTDLNIEDSIKIYNNYFKTNGVTTTIVGIGGETNTTKNKGAQFYNNRVIGYLYDNPDTSGTQHACLFTSGGDMIIKNNYISHSTLGLVVKCGDGLGYSEGGIWSNLVTECGTALWMRGVGGINVFNNTFYHSDINYGASFSRFIYADENSATAGNQYSKNIIIKNNLLHSEISNGYLIGLDDTASVSSVIEYNNLYGASNVLYATGNYRQTIADANVIGYMNNCSNENLNLTNLMPTSAVFGVSLDNYYNNGLDVLTMWGGIDTTPSVITKEQLLDWQMGAILLP